MRVKVNQTIQLHASSRESEPVGGVQIAVIGAGNFTRADRPARGLVAEGCARRAGKARRIDLGLDGAGPVPCRLPGHAGGTDHGDCQHVRCQP